MATALNQTVVEQSVNDTATISAEVETNSAEAVFVFIDDGTSGGDPASYDFEAEFQTTPDSGTYNQWADESGKTTHDAYEHPATPYSYRATVTNQSGAAQNIRLRVVAVKFD